MLNITNSQNAGAAIAYFKGALSHGDYYADEVPGKWHGLGAARLGLIGRVDEPVFAALIENIDPRTGERLTARTKEDRRPGTDFTFNAPKSVSLLHALSGDDRIIATFRQAVVETMREIEAEARTRVREGGRDETRVTGNLAWAEFLHTTSRPVGGVPDPHLHIHAYVVNATWDAREQRWKALDVGMSKADAPYYEAAFLARLAHGMKALGYCVERHGRFWDVAGLPRELIQSFSRRTAEIEAKAAELGITADKAKAELGKRTRARKSKELAPEDCRRLWQERAGKSGMQAIRRARGARMLEPEVSAAGAIDFAGARLFERASVATEKGLLAAALQRGFGDVTPEEVRAASGRLNLIDGEIAGRKVVSTREILAEETRMIGFARTGRLACRALAPEAKLSDVEQLTAGQRQAIEHVWRSPDRVMVVRGQAGTGKTTLLRAAVAGMEDRHVAVFAPTSAARDVLRKEGFEGAETLQRLLSDERLQQGLAGSVVWVDEAGLISVPQMARLFEVADRVKARVVLMGDSGQHGSVERGDALRLIERHAGIRAASVNEIVRQRGAYRRAVEEIAAGDIARGWASLEKLGSIVELQGEERFAALASAYASSTGAGRTVMVVSPTHAEKDRVTAAIRERLAKDGRLGEERQFTVWRDLGLTIAEKSDTASYRPGQWVKFHVDAPCFRRGTKAEVIEVSSERVLVRAAGGKPQALLLEKAEAFKVYAAHEKAFAVGDPIRITENGSTASGKFVNGQIHVITGFDLRGNLKLERGRVLPGDYGAFDHGYASTSVSAQGRTVDEVLVAMGESSLPATFLEQFYVTVSRGREGVRIFTDDAVSVRAAVERSGERGSATELVEQKLDRKLKPFREATATAESRKQRIERFTEAMARHIQHLGKRDRSAERGEDERELRRLAKEAAIVEYRGRVRGPELELGG